MNMDFVVTFIRLLFTILSWAIIIRILLTWIRVEALYPVARILEQITEPILAPARRIIPPMGGLDLSPIIVLVLLNLVERLLLSALN
ncbi:MAG: YggT family protein [Caldilineales bacterium]|nr:YggT family protein [Caldilineales bacterium]